MYIIHDVKYDTYLTSGTQKTRDGGYGPRWTVSRRRARLFGSVAEAKAAMHTVKRIKNQDNRYVIYERA